jgi:hypothetical protein
MGFALLMISGFGCDPEHKNKCQWYLIPDLDRKDNTDMNEGMIPVCARNLSINKQDCRLQASLEFAENAFNKKFKYNDMKIKSVLLPREITEIKFCGK